jgi:ribonuclease BN (tRNA processing enzyme)
VCEMIQVDVLYSTSAIGTQILLTKNGQHTLVDIGDGAVRDLVSRKVDFGSIKAILLTHEHFDHFSGLYAFLHFCRLLRRTEDLMIIAPNPIRVVKYLLRPPVMYEQLLYKVRLLPIQENESVNIGSLNITAFSVNHGRANALGYSVVDEENYRAVFSGDTTACENLRLNVLGADIAVLEATYDNSQVNLAAKYGHMTRSQASGFGKKAKKVVYVHSSPKEYFKKFSCSTQEGKN